MRIVIDIEANGLEDATKVWVICCKDIDTGQIYIFRNIDGTHDFKDFLEFSEKVTLWIGHNWLGYDWGHLVRLCNLRVDDVCLNSIDTLIISKLADYPRPHHSIEDYGIEFGYPKLAFSDFSKYTSEMEEYCVRDVEICHKVYNKYLKYISNPDFRSAIVLEHKFQLIVNDLHDNGFAFDSARATKLLEKVSQELSKLDKDILEAFPPKLKLIKEITPRETKHGTLSKTDFRWVADGDLSIFNGGPFCRVHFVPFNPSSTKQIVDTLHAAGWQPVNKTKTRIELERECSRLKYKRTDEDRFALRECSAKLEGLGIYGYKVDEANISTLPVNAPAPARLLAKRILLESRRRTLTEWLSLVREGGRIHGEFFGLGAWTHRMAHQKPNTANIPNEFDLGGKTKLFGKEMRQLWTVPKNRLLVGVDAEGIQLRIFAHYINDQEFTDALVRGRKDDKTDPHSLNQRVLGSVCRSRAAAKRFIFALLLGAGIDKLAEILGCTRAEAQEALDRLIQRYTGFAVLKETLIPADGARGFFYGLDGRAVRIPGETSSARKHLAMSGYLQSGEAIVMKRACVKFSEKLPKYQAFLVDFVHDEWQTECPNDYKIAKEICELQCSALKEVGEELKLKCPLAGSYWNDETHDFTIGTNWSQTH